MWPSPVASKDKSTAAHGWRLAVAPTLMVLLQRVSEIDEEYGNDRGQPRCKNEESQHEETGSSGPGGGQCDKQLGQPRSPGCGGVNPLHDAIGETGRRLRVTPTCLPALIRFV